MSKIELLLLIVFLLLLILLFKYLQTKRQIRNLSKQIAELVNGKSEKMLDISLIDKDLEQLAGILNQYNDNQRQLKLICHPILSISILITAWWKGFYKIY